MLLQAVASSSAAVQKDISVDALLGLARNFNYNDDSNPNVNNFHNDVD